MSKDYFRVEPEKLKAYIANVCDIADSLKLTDDEFLACQKISLKLLCDYHRITPDDISIIADQKVNPWCATIAKAALEGKE
jgi:hypothetical protein